MNTVIVVTLFLTASYVVATELDRRRLSKELKKARNGWWESQNGIERFRQLLYEESQKVAELAPKAIAFRLAQEFEEAKRKREVETHGTQEG